MREAVIEKKLCEGVRRLGGEAYKFTSPARRSVPDRMCVFPGGAIVFVECKAPHQAPTDAQAREHARLYLLGQDVRVIDSVVGVHEFINEMAARLYGVAWQRHTSAQHDDVDAMALQEAAA